MVGGPAAPRRGVGPARGDRRPVPDQRAVGAVRGGVRGRAASRTRCATAPSSAGPGRARSCSGCSGPAGDVGRGRRRAITDELGYDPGVAARLRRGGHAPGRPRRGSARSRRSSSARADPDGDVAAFVEELAAGSRSSSSGRGVNLLTYHRAKGLEFDAVFLPRLLDGELPFRSGRSKADPEEERRLLYVGITRARRYLFLTWPTRREARRAARSWTSWAWRGSRGRNRTRGPRASSRSGAAMCWIASRSWRRKRAEGRRGSRLRRVPRSDARARSPRACREIGPISPRSRASVPPSSSATGTRCLRSSRPSKQDRRRSYATVSAIGTAASAIDTGHPALADSAASRNPSASIPGHVAGDPESDARDALPFLKVDLGARVERRRRVPGIGEDARQLHREAGRVRGGDQLLRAGASLGLLGPGRPCDVERPEPARVERHPAAALDQRAVPFP